MRTVTIFNRKKSKIAGKMRIIITAKISILGHPNVFKFIQIIVTPFITLLFAPPLIALRDTMFPANILRCFENTSKPRWPL
jgi:hypothetical protein